MQEKLKVLQLGPFPPPVGGMATVVATLAEGLKAVADVHVLNNAKTTARDRPLWRGVGAQLSLLKQLAVECMSWRADIVHIHTCSWFTFWRNAVDVAMARAFGRSVIVHIHGGQFADFIASMNEVQRWVAKITLGSAHRVVILGKYLVGPIGELVDQERLLVLPNGVHIGTPVPVKANSAEFRIACLGSYGARKGQEDLIRAAALLRPSGKVRLQLAGDEAVPGHRAELERLAASVGLRTQVSLSEPITGAEKEAWLREADCFCLPSYVEAFPMVMLEAMAIGLPAVLTRVGAIPEAVSDGTEALLCNAGDLPALASHLQDLMDHPERRETIGLQGRQRIVREYDLDANLRRLEQVYRTLVVEKRGMAPA